MEKRVLLHCCCAPCSAAILEWLLANGYEPVLFFYNPNIFPQQEYLLRKGELVRHAESLSVPYIDESALDSDDWDRRHSLWLGSVSGLENEPERGRRCLQCFSYRLNATARYAAANGFPLFTTTLASSRWKSIEDIPVFLLRIKGIFPFCICLGEYITIGYDDSFNSYSRAGYCTCYVGFLSLKKD